MAHAVRERSDPDAASVLATFYSTPTATYDPASTSEAPTADQPVRELETPAPGPLRPRRAHPTAGRATPHLLPSVADKHPLREGGNRRASSPPHYRS
jgi:hypothetical protein